MTQGQPLQVLKQIPLQRHISPLQPQAIFPAWWQDLHQAASNGVLFLSREWVETWLEVYGRSFGGKWVWWSHNGTVVGGCLLLTRSIRLRFFSFRTLFLNAAGTTTERSPLSEFNDVLYVAGFEDMIAQDLSALLHETECDILKLSGCPDNGIISRVLAFVPHIKLEIERKPAPYVDLARLPAAPFETQLTANTRSQIKKSARIYENTYGSVSLRSAASLDDALNSFDEMAKMHNARWTSKGVAGSFSNQSAVAFHRELIRRLWPRGEVALVCAKAGDHTIGILYNFIMAGKVYFFQSGFAYQQDNRLKPGLLTHCLAIENYRSRGLLEYDFLAGDAQYKRSFSTDERSIFWATVFRDRSTTRFYLWAKKIKALLRISKTKART